MLANSTAPPRDAQPCFLLLSQAYGAWAGSAIQLDRAGQGQHAPTTVYKTASTVRRMLGFSQNVLQQSSPLTLAAMLNGDMVAVYASFSLVVRCALSATTRSPTHPDTTLQPCRRHNKPQQQQTAPTALAATVLLRLHPRAGGWTRM